MKWFLCLAMVTLVLPMAALAQTSEGETDPAPAEEPSLTDFVPRPEKVLVQKDSTRPSLGNTLVLLALSTEQIKLLEQRTGQTDLIAVGPEDSLVVFRDDGLHGDRVKGDALYSAIADIDRAELAARAATERTNEDTGENVVPVFDGRTLVGETEVAAFDIEAFDRGEMVVLERSLSISSANGLAPETEEGGVRSMSAAAVVPGTNQFQDRVLMIRHPLVVQDPLRTFDPCNGGTPMGPWTFGHLATEMANPAASGINPSTFVENWLLEWATAQPINGFSVPPRIAIQALINDWRAASGGGNLDLSIAPLRLLAINPRIDLRTTTGGGGGYAAAGSGNFLDAGEARFTFGVILPPGYNQSKAAFNFNVPMGGGCDATRFSIIFEYRVPKCKCEHVRDWARAWHRLNSFAPGTVSYNGLLEKLTRTFTDAGANPTRPNRSAIGQVRSNEIALRQPWEIREFQLVQFPFSFLEETTTADTPEDGFNNTNTVGNYILDFMNGILGNVPLEYPLLSGNSFLGAHPQTPNPANMFWNAPNINVANPPEDNARHLVSLGTCNACHGESETRTTFQHIESFHPAPPAVISQFLTGTVPPIPDPAGSGTMREFDDLARREIDINAVARMVCGRFRPIRLRPVIIGPIGPLSSEGEVVSMSAAATADPDPAAPPLAISPEDFLREPVRQVH